MEEAATQVQPQARHGVWHSVPPKVRLIILSQILNAFTFGYFGIYITGYLVQSGISTSFVIGIILGVEGIVMVVAGIPFAMLSDRRGRKWIIIIGNVVFAPVIIVFGLTTNVFVFGLAAAVAGLGEAMALSSWNAMIADMTDLGNRDSAFSLSFITGAAASSLGAALPFAFPLIESIAKVSSDAVHVNAILVLGVANFATPLFLWFLLKDHHETLAARKEGMKLGGMGPIMKFSVCNSIIGFGAGLIIPLLVTWLLLKFGVQDNYSGPYAALSGLTIAFAAIASPRLSRKLGLFPAILTTQISSTVFMFSLAFISNVYLAGGVYLIRAALMNMNSPLMDSFLMGITPPQRRGLASTLNAIIWRIPNSGSSIIGGYILYSAAFGIPALGLSNLDVPWVLATMFYVVGAALLFASFRHMKPSQ